MEAIKKCIFILKKTNDGNDLAGWQLYLIQCVCNCPADINEKGWEELEKMYEDCKNGTFKKPFHFDVENVTKDHEHYIYYKDIQIEHFTYRDNHEGERKATEKLGKVCKYLEDNNLKINFRNYCKLLNVYGILNKRLQQKKADVQVLEKTV